MISHKNNRMKNKLVALAVSIILLSGACGSNNQNENSEGSGNIVDQSKESQLDGAKLISTSDCRACHGDKETIIGPGYEQVAERYPKNDSTISYLAGKIITGGAGNWGDTPMTPHPQLSQAEAEAMARFILSLKN